MNLSIIFLFVFLLSLVPSGTFATTPAKPNIIVILVDDKGYSDLSCFGGKTVTTKHLDRLAAEGIRFRQHYVASPICSPSPRHAPDQLEPAPSKAISCCYGASLPQSRRTDD
jgi:hypothetical protein